MPAVCRAWGRCSGTWGAGLGCVGATPRLEVELFTYFCGWSKGERHFCGQEQNYWPWSLIFFISLGSSLDKKTARQTERVGGEQSGDADAAECL